MRKSKSTKQALLLSVMSLLLCVSMLVGTTFAWFTDSVSTAKNTISSGNLDVELYYKLDLQEPQWKKVSSTTELFDDAALWEPGFTQVVYLKVVNEGSLALKYQLGMNVIQEREGMSVTGEIFELSNFIMYGYEAFDDEAALPADRMAARAAVAGNAKLIQKQYHNPEYSKGELAPAGEDLLTLCAWMPETVGNEANHNGTIIPAIQLGLNLVATQKTSETDSFDELYDQDAVYEEGYGYSTSMTAKLNGDTAYHITVRNTVTNAKMLTMVVDDTAIADADKPIEVFVKLVDTDSRIPVESFEKAFTYDITVTNLKAGNTEPVKVELRADTNLTGVKLFHEDQPVEPIIYTPQDGYLTFYTASFSPFTVVYNAEVAYEQPDANPQDLPVASVVNSAEFENVDLPWENYGSWSPTEGLDSQLEAAYTFSCVDTLDEAIASPYANWYCDFVVKLDRDLGANQIFLGGNYGSFGWVGFHNGDLTLAANEEVPLLGSIAGDWTYTDVVQNVRSFICGVGDVDDALKGATFTVMLRLTNPQDATEFYNVATINYTFD